MKSLIVIPTLNESNNIKNMIIIAPEDIENEGDKENIDEEFEDLIIEKIKKN